MATPDLRTSNLRGIFAMLAAVATFAVMDVCMKRLVETYPSVQVTFLRGISSIPFLLVATAMFGRWSNLIPRRWILHVARGLLAFIVLWLFVYSVKHLSLGDAYSIFMSAPLLITALSVPMLREKVGWRRWTAVVAGLLGVMVMLRPTGGGWISVGGLAALAAAFGYAVNAITIRMLSRSDTGAATIFWSLLVLTATSGLASIATWMPIQLHHAGWILSLGLSGALGQYFITYAFRCAPPSVLAPLEYTALAWAMIFDYVLWLVAPSGRMLIGAAIIVASGVYVFRREKKLTVDG